jgi:hypothetical protein
VNVHFKIKGTLKTIGVKNQTFKQKHFAAPAHPRTTPERGSVSRSASMAG